MTAPPRIPRKAPADNAAMRFALPLADRTNDSGMSYTHGFRHRLAPPAGSLRQQAPCLIPFNVFARFIKLLFLIISAVNWFVKEKIRRPKAEKTLDIKRDWLRFCRIKTLAAGAGEVEVNPGIGGGAPICRDPES